MSTIDCGDWSNEKRDWGLYLFVNSCLFDWNDEVLECIQPKEGDIGECKDWSDEECRGWGDEEWNAFKD